MDSSIAGEEQHAWLALDSSFASGIIGQSNRTPWAMAWMTNQPQTHFNIHAHQRKDGQERIPKGLKLLSKVVAQLTLHVSLFAKKFRRHDCSMSLCEVQLAYRCPGHGSQGGVCEGGF